MKKTPNTSKNIIQREDIAIDKISVCINDDAIRQILLGLFPEKKNNRKINEEVNKYLREIQWKTFNQKIKDYDYHHYLDILIDNNLLAENVLDGFKKDLNDCTVTKRLDKIYETPIITKYFKVRPCIKEQDRKEPHSGTNNEDIKSNIFFGFNVAEYQNISHVDNKEPLLDLLELIKLVLFLDLRYLIEDCFEKQITYRALINSITLAVDNSIVTGLELSNKLTSSNYYYEDYCHELSQLTFKDSKSSLVINSPNKQSLTFIYKDQKVYCDETIEDIEDRKKRTEKSKKKRAQACINGINKSIDDEIKEIYPESELGVSFFDEDMYDDENNEEDEYAGFEIDEETKKEKIKTKIAFRKDKKVGDHKGIEISVKISGREDIQKLLPLSFLSEEVIHSGMILTTIKGCEESIFNNCVLGFFNGLEQTKENFSKVKRSTFSLDANFIASNIKSKRGAVARILMLIHFASSSNEDDETKENLSKQFPKIRKLIEDLKNKRKGAKSKRAVLCLYEHFKERLNVE